MPNGAVAVAGDKRATKNGWLWAVGHLDAQGQTTVTAQVRVTGASVGGALVGQVDAIARNLKQPAHTSGGALVLLPDPASVKAAFTPGVKSILRSTDGAINVELPERAFDRPLDLSMMPPGSTVVTSTSGTSSTLVLPAATSAVSGSARLQLSPNATVLPSGETLPPPIAGTKRGFGTFFLQARDGSATVVHKFAAPLKVQLHYTTEQLAALRISPSDLTLFWFDEDLKTWVPLQSEVDPVAQTVTVNVDHFSAFQLADGSSASANYIPTLQPFQTSLFTGASAFTYPIAVPAGPNGVKPDVALHYNSAQTDGTTGLHIRQQAGWAGKGWNLDTGAIAQNKQLVDSGTHRAVVYYTLTLNGTAVDLVGYPNVTNADRNDPTQWTWHPTDENFVRVVPLYIGPAWDGNPGRGGVVNGTWAKRYRWQVWTKDGTRYDFEDDLWWGWCTSQSVSFETYKWLLTRVVDTHGNTIDYGYGRGQLVGSAQNCGAGNLSTRGTVDYDAWPTEIRWGGNSVTGLSNHFWLEFTSNSRPNGLDTQYDGAEGQYGGSPATPHQTRQLVSIKVWALPDSGWSLVRGYQFVTDGTTLPDNPSCEGMPCTLFPKLTLKSIQPFGSDASSTLPKMDFGYVPMASSNNVPNGGVNRINSITTGYGAQITFQYQNIHDVVAVPSFSNSHRVAQRSVSVNPGTTFAASYTWSYVYGTPLYNTIATSAVQYYNKYRDTAHDWRAWLARKEYSEFRGHSYTVEIQPDGSQVEHFFRQGQGTCALTATGNGLPGDACFQQWRNAEFQKGNEWLTRVRSGVNWANLQETERTFTTTFYGVFGTSREEAAI